MRKERKLLRQQLELLAEQSKATYERDLSELSNSMCEICKSLVQSELAVVVQLALLAYFVVSFLILFKKLFRGKF